MKHKRLFLVLTLLTIACFTHARAQAYRCQEGGKTVYQATPCSGGKAIDTRPSSEGVSGMRQDADRIAAKEAQQAAAEKKVADDKAAKAERRKEAIRNQPRSMTCRPNYYGGMYCN